MTSESEGGRQVSNILDPNPDPSHSNLSINEEGDNLAPNENKENLGTTLQVKVESDTDGGSESTVLENNGLLPPSYDSLMDESKVKIPSEIGTSGEGKGTEFCKDPKGPAPPAQDEERNENKVQKKGARKFFQGVKEDLMNKDLVPLKILFFFKYATLFVLYPFMTLHVKSLGMTAPETGIQSALIPAFVVFAPPFSGMIADKIGNFKVFLTALTIANAPLALALLLVPIAREVVTLPEMLTLDFACASPESMHPFILQTIDSSICQIESPDGVLSSENFGSPKTLRCGTLCKNSYPSPSLPFFEPRSYGAESYRLSDEAVFTTHKNKKPRLTCTSSANCTFHLVDFPDPNFKGEDIIEVQKLRLIGASPGNVTRPKFGIEMLNDLPLSSIHSPECDQTLRVKNGTCRNVCLIQYPRNLVCSNKKEEKVYNVALTFWLYTLLRILLGVASATSFIMFEGAVLAILKEFGGDYGLQRVTATLAAIIFAPLSGLLIQLFHNFYPAFYLYAVLQIFSGVLTLKIDLRFKPPTEKILGHLKEVLTQVEILIFFGAMLLSGTSWGYLESFLFWFLQDLNATNVLMGLTISIGGIFGIPVLILSRPIIKRYGHVNILCLGLGFYAIRLIGYSFIENPWLCLPFEAMEAITASLAITAAATYAASLSNSQTIASIQGIWGGLYFGFGRGTGSLLGGFFHKWYGARNTFRIFSIMSLIGGILYFVINQLYIKKYSMSLRKTEGLDLNDIRGDRHKRAVEGSKEIQNGDKGHTNEGYIESANDTSFTDIPLNEDAAPPNESKSNNNSGPPAVYKRS